MANQTLFLADGQQLKLGGVLGRGGEGDVYEIVGRPQDVAKIYSKPVSHEKALKLQAMVTFDSPKLYERMAWPKALIVPERGKPPVGFVMPKIEGFEEIHDLYSPKGRLQKFPRASWKSLTHTAINICAAFILVHNNDIVIGDVNEKNIRVSDRTSIRLIDCDSFQITQNGVKFLCEVGVEHFTPPELQGGSFRGVERTPNHDAFGLAVLIFYLLFMGRHPYSGRYLGVGEMPLGKAIHENRFAYGNQSRQRRMEPPPNALPLSIVGHDLSDLFERAFAPPSPKESRPSPGEWRKALKSHFESLVACTHNAAHQYRRESGYCPWCHLEARTHAQFFLLVPATAASQPTAPPRTGVSIDELWRDIELVQHPGPLQAPTIPIIQAAPWAVAASVMYQRVSYGTIAFGITLGLVALILPISAGLIGVLLLVDVWFTYGLRERYLSQSREQRNSAHSAQQAANKALGDAKQQWESDASGQQFTVALDRLRRLKDEYAAIEHEKQLRLQRFREQAYQQHRDRFLDSHRIDRANITGIGPSRAATLMSYGVETALDVKVSAILAVPGFGEVLTHALMSWRKMVESQFQSVSSAQMSSSDVVAVNHWADGERQRIEQALQKGPAELVQIAKLIDRRRRELQPELERALEVAAQAEADWKVFQSRI